ncbi:MAG: hypothetical protein SV775_14230 [Thermodesulfobacteriota bacterium]|nr:hypothetical protein [Thermodesulfobacteriota bacterium]
MPEVDTEFIDKYFLLRGFELDAKSPVPYYPCSDPYCLRVHRFSCFLLEPAGLRSMVNGCV